MFLFERLSSRPIEMPGFARNQLTGCRSACNQLYPRPRQARGPKKVKGTKSAPRQPFLTFVSKDGIEIRVGRGSADNDKLSLDPQLRDSRDWWMHVAGHPGSHVVIRCQEDDLPSAHPETMKDAAALAAKNSKVCVIRSLSLILFHNI